VKALELVDLGLALRERIAALEKQLEEIESQLIVIARQGEQVPLKDEDREGRQFLAQGTEATIPIVFTADKIIGSFASGSAVNKRIYTALPEGKSLRLFYLPKTVWEMSAKNGKQFRASAEEELGAAAPKFISACVARDKDGIPKSDIKVEWSRAFKEA